MAGLGETVGDTVMLLNFVMRGHTMPIAFSGRSPRTDLTPTQTVELRKAPGGEIRVGSGKTDPLFLPPTPIHNPNEFHTLAVRVGEGSSCG